MCLWPMGLLFWVWHWLTVFGTWVYDHETMCHVHSWSRYDLELFKIYRVFEMFSCPAHNSFLVWHWLTIFGTWLYHKTMCHIHLWSRFDVDLWPPGQIYRLLSCLHVWPVTSVSFDIGIPYLAHGSITIRECIKYIHDPDMTLTFDLNVKFIGFMTWLCVQASVFLSFDIVILCLARECITMVQCVSYIHELCMTLTFDLNIKIIFSPWIWVWQDVFALRHGHTKFRHSGVSPWDNMLCTFLTLLWH